ncbi:phosphatase PAP2/dual specificity phosphatase family protein [Stenotrophomonas maltophilia]|uniref:phosphatase PAP2/dual specificity phosphatase family protein n=1 Tax=Stenotrophomonas maltophilia TaxID=40324 RepID=UPI0018D2E872|nr:phosphatase PAP2/dual specificity phosphatase family protein [Stenotrophomonas maltophilia]MBH1386148.1 phosphatase PAP2/dual specificity phosphatase family protein [Stenotrophomonas maltophilia]MBN5106725.1 phosphatase PAP2/dual specificity phosphatase family protein [Stenotrophomonas maltophilia]MCM2521070.1 phosphatase PAP2/dual specificity phosphatase family protein [Stenotrophomonas maltophilia]HDX0803233.1 phosphatase PAP2/dual specificity phosphatase family protein [Stenotrophomonas m
MAAEGRPWRRALLWLALLGPFFFASYGFANWMAGRHATLPVMAFAWETRIPFVPWTIVPYWSIDLFYAISFFLCRHRLELDRHALRLFSAQVIAVTCFLLWPLRFSFERPEIGGVFGWLFDVLLGFDKPFNQAPSLHIVLLIVLWVKFAQYLHGAWRGLLHVWALLIGVSVLTTFQHHFIDIPTGLLAGWLCVWLWPEQGTPPLRAWRTARDARRWRLAALYLLGAAALLVPVVLLRGAALWLLWPVVSLLLVALAYAGLGTAVFQKRADGRLTMAARWLLAPYLGAAWINSRLWTRRAPQPVPVLDGVWLGRIPCTALPAPLVGVVDACAELSCCAPGAAHAGVPMLDLVVPTPEQLCEAAEAIECLRAQGPLLVCCALGYSRSAASVAAWLLRSGRAADADTAVAIVRSARPGIVLGTAHLRAITDAAGART